jgi:predicted Rossmann-fold nucleotide-binding protein
MVIQASNFKSKKENSICIILDDKNV